MKQVADKVAIRLCRSENSFHFRAVGKLYFTAGGVSDQLRYKIAGHLLLFFAKQVAEAANAGKLLAVGGYAAGIDLAGPTIFTDPASMNPLIGPFAFARCAVALAKPSYGIEALEGEPRRVDMLVATGATGHA